MACDVFPLAMFFERQKSCNEQYFLEKRQPFAISLKPYQDFNLRDLLLEWTNNSQRNLTKGAISGIHNFEQNLVTLWPEENPLYGS